MEQLPKIISVDDHVVEPSHVWQTWLPEKYREKGPRIIRERFGKFNLVKGAKYMTTRGDEAGSAGGGVASGKIKGEAEFMLYSFDVKLEGKNACRFP